MIEELLTNDSVIITEYEKKFLMAHKISVTRFRKELLWSGKSKTNIFIKLLCSKPTN